MYIGTTSSSRLTQALNSATATRTRRQAASAWVRGYCGSTPVLEGAKHKTMKFRCRTKGCRKRFSVRTGTVMESSKLGFQVWAIAIYLMTTNLKGISSMKLHRELNITQRSAWFLAHRLRKTWADDGAPFAGPVEVDETFVGGKAKSMHASDRALVGPDGRGNRLRSPVSATARPARSARPSCPTRKRPRCARSSRTAPRGAPQRARARHGRPDGCDGPRRRRTATALRGSDRPRRSPRSRRLISQRVADPHLRG